MRACTPVKNGSQAANERFFVFPELWLDLLISNAYKHYHHSSEKDFEPRRSHFSKALKHICYPVFYQFLLT
jgi:hypothetical protein